MSVRTFDPALVAITVGGYPISGYADGTFIRVERSSDMFTKVVGADGTPSRSKSNDRSGTITLTLQQTSPSNADLMTIALLDELSSTGVVPVVISDTGGLTTFFGGTAWVRKSPDWEGAGGGAIGNVEWNLDVAALDVFIGGNVTSDGD